MYNVRLACFQSTFRAVWKEVSAWYFHSRTVTLNKVTVVTPWSLVFSCSFCSHVFYQLHLSPRSLVTYSFSRLYPRINESESLVMGLESAWIASSPSKLSHYSVRTLRERDYNDGQDPGSLLTEALRTNTFKAKQRVINIEIKEQRTVGRRDGLHCGTLRSRYYRISFQLSLKGEVEFHLSCALEKRNGKWL